MENISRERALSLLNAPDRLSNLKKLVRDAREGRLPLPVTTEDVNNHIHTTYSFSPYSPTAAAWFAWQAGLCTAGLMDHDSIAGAEEFLEACEIVGIGGTIGIECRVDMSNTPFAGLKINNPDQKGIMYTCIHAVPRGQAAALNGHFAPLREKRNIRNRRMVEAINGLMGRYGVAIDFDRDVIPLSNCALGGTVTERHLSSALAQRMIDVVGGGRKLVSFIVDEMKLPLPGNIQALLLDDRNPHMMYDLLGWIKSELIARFYIDATDELMDVGELVQLAERIHAISADAYLGDVIGDSITGDKKTQAFEDAFLPELLTYLKGLGYRAVTYGPSRNTKPQFDRLKALCAQHELFQISGEDINQPRQSFVCVAQRDPSFRNLYEAAWALIAHERIADRDPNQGLFSPASELRWPNLDERVLAFARMGREMV